MLFRSRGGGRGGGKGDPGGLSRAGQQGGEAASIQAVPVRAGHQARGTVWDPHLAAGEQAGEAPLTGPEPGAALPHATGGREGEGEDEVGDRVNAELRRVSGKMVWKE